MASASDNMTSLDTMWPLRPFDRSWMSEAFVRDTEAMTRALQRSISGDPTTSPNPDEAPSSHHPSQSVSTSSDDPEATVIVSKRFVPPSKRKITKRKSRASKRSPTTFITADAANFRQMVQQVTGVRFSPGSVPVLKPEPHRMVNRLQAGCMLPTLDTSAFLLDHHHVASQETATSAQGFVESSSGVGGGTGFDFDGFSCFPTLESWKVM